MSTREPRATWDALMQVVASQDAERVDEFLDALPPGETARTVSRLDDDEQTQLLLVLSPEDAADLIEELPDAQAIEMLENAAPETVAAIFENLPSDEIADYLTEFDTEDVDAVLAAMEPAAASEALALSAYDDDVAGGLMVKEFLAYPRTHTVDDVVEDLRANADKYSEYNVQYIFVTTPDSRLAGVLRLRDLLLAKPKTPIEELMLADPLHLSDDSPLTDLQDFFDSHAFFGVPIIDADGRLVGVVQRAGVEEALGEQAESDFRRAQGIVHEEFRSMPTLLRARRRLGWLSVNIVLNVLAASVIAFFQDVLAQVIALAVFLPIVSDMSGCSGNQAVAVSVRELALGIVRPGEVFYVWLKEAGVGALNGLLLGTLLGVVGFLWQGNWVLGVVIGVALFANTLVAVSLGGVLPLILKGLRVDPALASGPILTTVTDMCGFFLVLSLASMFLEHLI
jgi:magnesium transporter